MESRLGQEEFRNELLCLISKKILTDEYLESNIDFINVIIFDAWKDYYSNIADISLYTYKDIFESLLYNIFKYKPSTDYIP